MKVLQSCRENFAFYGINPPPSFNDSLINKRNLIVLFILVTNTIFAIVFFSYKAENIAEYADSFSSLWSVILISAQVSFLIHNIRDVFKFVERLESTINKSKVVY